MCLRWLTMLALHGSMPEKQPLPHVHGEVFLVDEHTLAALMIFRR